MVQQQFKHVSGIKVRIGLLVLMLIFVVGTKITKSSDKSLFYKSSVAQSVTDSVPNAVALLSGSYTGTVAINEPLALGVLDISLTLTDRNGLLNGVLNGNGSLAYPSAAILEGSITEGTNGITPTFSIDSSLFGSVVSDRQVTRRFTITGSVHDPGNVLTGNYIETITGFTSQPIIVKGVLLASRAAPVAAGSLTPVTPTPSSARIYLPLIENRRP